VITFVADGTATLCGADFSSRAYQRWVGFTFDMNASGCSVRLRMIVFTGTNNYMEFWNNTIRDGGDGFVSALSLTADSTNYCVFFGNTFINLTYYAPGGEQAPFSTAGTHSFFAYNEAYDIYADFFHYNGTYNWFLNNYFHGDIEYPGGAHPDFFQHGTHPLGLSYNVHEANYMAGMAAEADRPNEHFSIIQNYDAGRCPSPPCVITENVFRRNVMHNLGNGSWGNSFATVGAHQYYRLYHNSIASPQLETDAYYGGNFYNGVDYVYIKNNLDYEPSSTQLTYIEVYHLALSNFGMGYNLAYSPRGSISFISPWTTQTSKVENLDPLLVNPASDLRLTASSPAIGAGGPLTTVASTSGTGTTFSVATGTGGYFRGPDTSLPQYGGNLTKGDTITVGTDVLTVASVSGDAVTVTSSFTWANGDPVYFGNDTTPDIGAYPYKSGGYTLSATYSGSGTITISPNDASLVRFVVCYSSNVPYEVDHTSPYTCTAPSGTFSARAYPLFASSTQLYAQVTAGGSVPAAPTNVRIR
jgi:hypothetical protein